MTYAEGARPDTSLADAVTLADIRAAAKRLDGVAKRTPVLTSRAIDHAVGATCFVKCENLQRVGAFKFRGAFNALAQLTPEARAKGVLTYSSGNHAQAVALAAALLRIPAVIVMPANAPDVKLRATRAYLADAPGPSDVVVYDPATTVREELGGAIAKDRGLTVIPPYDHPHVIAGQGTTALELLEESGPLDHLFVCCGGGGLLSGCAVAAKGLSPRTRVIGVEPELADDATRSFRAGTLQTVRNPPTIADGARTPYLGRYTFAIVAKYADEMCTVSERELAAAMALLMERLRVVVEPTGALAAAGAIRTARERPEQLAGSRIGIIISGGNVDLADIPALLAIAAN
ncbi:MAG: threo-3-hydroxy-L-aspartate ammonia-lyase [Phycisphaerales bacterium]|nr:threo-3-hydroxy-L-aspartate ammonia-lyase [Phycisphaerales bacterium]